MGIHCHGMYPGVVLLSGEGLNSMEDRILKELLKGPKCESCYYANDCPVNYKDTVNCDFFKSIFKSRDAEIKKLREALWMDQPYDLMSCLKQLIKGVDILLHRYDYDDDNWEMMHEAWRTAKEALKDGE